MSLTLKERAALQKNLDQLIEIANTRATEQHDTQIGHLWIAVRVLASALQLALDAPEVKP